jgi:hypothetical protein
MPFKEPLIRVWYDDRKAYASIAEDPRFPGISVRLDNLNNNTPESIYESLKKLGLGMKVIRTFFKKAFEQRLWIDNPFVEDIVTK